jgi:1-phosphofructokinase family hexose kinase
MRSAQNGAHPASYDVIITAPSPAIDSYYVMDTVNAGNVNRARYAFHTAGGKGNNMSRAVRLLGGAALSVGIVGGLSGRFIVEELAREGIDADMVWSDFDTRRCSTVLTPERRETTVFLQPGAAAGDGLREAFAQKTLEHAARAPWVSLNGSLPPDFGPETYATLISALKARGVRTCLDCAGEALALGAAAGPTILKVNLEEFQTALTGGEDWTWRLAQGHFAELQASGTEILVITDGPRGAYVFNSAGSQHVATHVDTWVSTAGAGDTFLAAMIVALNRGQSLETTVVYASAAAAASLQQPGCGFLDPDDVRFFEGRTTLEAFTPEEWTR